MSRTKSLRPRPSPARLVERILSHRSPKARYTAEMLRQRIVAPLTAPAKFRMAALPRDWIVSGDAVIDAILYIGPAALHR